VGKAAMRNKPSIPQLIDNLSFIKTIDMMLLEGTSATNVAKFIQDDQKSLTDVNEKVLVNALASRKEKLREKAIEKSAEQTKEWFGGVMSDSSGDGDDEDDDDDTGNTNVFSFPGGEKVAPPLKMIPSVISRSIYDKKILGGLDELMETEAMYRTQRHRIDRLVTMEEEKGGYIDSLSREFKVANDLLMSRVAIKEKFGLIDGDVKFREQLDIKGYSEKTIQTLANAESRHRVVSLVEKLANIEKRKSTKRTAGQSEER
jgi:hypothetical protein